MPLSVHFLIIVNTNFAGEEPCYAGVPMSSIIEQGLVVGDVISLLWFKRSLPRYCTKFIEVSAFSSQSISLILLRSEINFVSLSQKFRYA